MANAYRDQNSIPTLIASSNVDGQTPVRVYADPVTHRLLVDTGGGSSGITSINTDTTAAQLLVVGTAGTDFAIVDNGTGTHTFNLPTASATNRGALSSADWTTFNGKGSGTVTAVSVASANGFAGSSSGGATPALTISTTITGILSGNGTAVAAAISGTNIKTVNGTSILGSGDIATPQGTVTAVSIATANGFSGSSSGGATPALTIIAGAITPTSVNGNTITTGSGTLTLGAGKTLTASDTTTLATAAITLGNGKVLTLSDSTTLNTNAITLAGGEVITFSASNALSLLTTGTTVMTFPAATDTVAVLGTAQTYTATMTEKQVVWTNNAITASSNAATVPITSRLNTVTNNSAATLTITMTTTSAVDGQLSMVRILDASAAAQTITWVNTENSTVSAPTTSNGSTTLPLTVGFQYNGGTSKWRCIANA